MPTYPTIATRKPRGRLSHKDEPEITSRFIMGSIHGTREILAACQAIIDTMQYDRLRSLKQLGNSHYAFPGAKHTRIGWYDPIAVESKRSTNGTVRTAQVVVSGGLEIPRKRRLGLGGEGQSNWSADSSNVPGSGPAQQYRDPDGQNTRQGPRPDR